MGFSSIRNTVLKASQRFEKISKEQTAKHIHLVQMMCDSEKELLFLCESAEVFIGRDRNMKDRLVAIKKAARRRKLKLESANSPCGLLLRGVVPAKKDSLLEVEFLCKRHQFFLDGFERLCS